jgi:membrane-associated phospholipid phosphatase
LPRGIAIPALVIEITMVVSAVPIGGHHLVDVFAGVAVAALSLAITLGLERIGQRNRVKLVPKASGLVRA